MQRRQSRQPSGETGQRSEPHRGDRTVATNRRARHDYAIEETFEAGLVLTGAEVKSLRAGRATLADAYARVVGEEVWVENLHIPPYEMASGPSRQSPTRPRKLLLHRDQIRRLIGKTAERGLTLVPLKIYFTRGLAKMELGLGKGKRKYEKREAIAAREHRREIERGFAARNRGRS
ncbi:MAG: SsrA-binding protein SmpB [Actinobacteria bacterium]|nr:MAG: SsrA-binding protein SmpB [Actinomycetota bacterium]